MKIFYISQLEFGGTAHSRLMALRELGFEVYELNYLGYFGNQSGLFEKIQMRYQIGPAIKKMNADILKLDETINADIVWIDKGIFIKPEVVNALKNKGRFLIQHNTDDIKYSNQGFQKYFYPSIPFFDIHITSNTFNLEELKDLGANDVMHMELAYNHQLHKPIDLSPEEFERYKTDVSFIGHWEPNTEKYIVALRERGIQVRLLGTGWKNAFDRQLKYTNIEGVFGEEYVKAIRASKINLCFVSAWNRNLTSARSFEIPACRSFMLAIRNEAHAAYYVEGKEVELFSDEEECAVKIKYYLEHEDERKIIADAGYRRCISSGYSDLERMRDIMEKITFKFKHSRKD